MEWKRMRWRALGLAAAAAVAIAAVATATAGSGSVTDVKSATAKYHDLAAATKAGYGLLKDTNGVACIAMDGMPGMGAMGYHYANSALVGDGAVNVTTPEALVYAPDAYGKLRLAAVEYVVLQSAWAAHHTAAPSLFGHRFALTPAGNRYGLPAFYSLHAWIWKNNLNGTFAMWNPEVTCP